MNLQSFGTHLQMIEVPSPTIPPATTTNAWIIGEHQKWIVDPAAHILENQESLLSLIQPLNLTGIFLTHHHKDHIASAVFLKERLNIPILAHQKNQPFWSFPIDHFLQEDDVFEGWQFIHTPGHAPGHLCALHQQSGDMIAGDMVAGIGTILINPKEGSIREYLNSLEKMQKHHPQRLLPAHGPILSNAIDAIQTYIQHRHQRLLQIEKQLCSTPQNTLGLAKEIYQELPTHFLGIAAIQLECGLIYLAEEGRAAQVSEGWIAI